MLIINKLRITELTFNLHLSYIFLFVFDNILAIL